MVKRLIVVPIVIAVLALVAVPSSATSSFTVTRSLSADTVASLVEVLVGDTAFTGAKINGLESLPIDGKTFTGTFSGGSDLLGVDEGLILAADVDPTDLTSNQLGVALPTVTQSASDPSQALLTEALYDIASTALSARSVQSATSIEFSLTPTADYFKLTYSLIISEEGSYGGSSWSGEVFEYPDGLGIFVKDSGQPWSASQNCAVVPTTSTYVAMESAGIVASQNTVSESRAVAQANYDALVAPTLEDGYQPTLPLPTIPSDLAAPGVAYETDRALGIGDRFITVPLTCVVDISTFTSSVDVGIVLANLNDSLVPPAVLLAGNSVGFSSNLAAVSAPQTPSQDAVSAPYTGPLLQEFSSRTLDVCTPKSITITGVRLSDVTASVQGKSVTVLENTATKLVLAFPAGLTPAQDVDLVINSSSGTLTHQDAFDIPADTCETELSKGRWTQLQSDGQTVKMYAKDPIGDGKIQFFVDGEEIAWVNAADEADPKLSFASGYPYLVRSVELKPGKNRFEIKLDGVRVWRATYVPKRYKP